MNLHLVLTNTDGTTHILKNALNDPVGDIIHIKRTLMGNDAAAIIAAFRVLLMRQ